MSTAGEPAWPRMGEAAFVAIPGGFVKTWAPHTEADPVGLLGAALCVAGCYLGNRSYFTIKPDRHPARHNVTLVGTTAKGRKSSALSCGEDLAKRTDPDWYAARRRSGFGSGEALIDALAPSEIEPAPDPRLLLVQHELAALLAAVRRDGSTLSPIIRNLYDGGPVDTATRGNGRKYVENHHAFTLSAITS